MDPTLLLSERYRLVHDESGKEYREFIYDLEHVEYEYISFFAMEYEWNYLVGDMDDLSPIVVLVYHIVIMDSDWPGF